MNFQLITQPQDLIDFCQACQASDWIAVDTEFLRQDSYFPKLSLIQIETDKGQAGLIDPLALADLSPLWAIFSNANIKKVFHSARQDLEVIYVASGQLPNNIFDTQLAAIFLGYGELAGFARVIAGELGITLEKDQTRTNWHARPLTEQQLNYAYADVHYLAPLYRQLVAKLSEFKLACLEANFNELLTEAWYKPNPEQAGAKIKSQKGLTAKQRHILYRLAQWREEEAIAQNTPKKWLVADDVLLKIAKRPPKTVEALYKVPQIKSSSVKEYGAIWIELIDHIFSHESKQVAPPQLEKPNLTEQQNILLQLLQSYVAQIALDYRLTYASLANKEQLKTLVLDPHSTPFIGWQQALVEAPLKQLLQGKQAIKVDQDRLICQT